jgi:hypothetical protein
MIPYNFIKVIRSAGLSEDEVAQVVAIRDSLRAEAGAEMNRLVARVSLLEQLLREAVEIGLRGAAWSEICEQLVMILRRADLSTEGL